MDDERQVIGPSQVYIRPVDPRQAVEGHKPNEWAHIGATTKLKIKTDYEFIARPPAGGLQ